MHSLCACAQHVVTVYISKASKFHVSVPMRISIEPQVPLLTNTLASFHPKPQTPSQTQTLHHQVPLDTNALLASLYPAFFSPSTCTIPSAAAVQVSICVLGCDTFTSRRSVYIHVTFSRSRFEFRGSRECLCLCTCTCTRTRTCTCVSV
jgi:hypothetical protein